MFYKTPIWNLEKAHGCFLTCGWIKRVPASQKPRHDLVLPDDSSVSHIFQLGVDNPPIVCLHSFKVIYLANKFAKLQIIVSMGHSMIKNSQQSRAGWISFLPISECSLACTVMFPHQSRPWGKDVGIGNLFRILSLEAQESKELRQERGEKAEK